MAQTLTRAYRIALKGLDHAAGCFKASGGTPGPPQAIENTLNREPQASAAPGNRRPFHRRYNATGYLMAARRQADR
jgi:hypothetical protein